MTNPDAGGSARACSTEPQGVVIDFDALRSRVAAGFRVPEHPPALPGPQAAVSVIFAPLARRDPALLLIRRAVREGDPWSGQIALPGGRREPEDPDILATARRETIEEVGHVLEATDAAQACAPIQARRRGLPIDLWIHPFVFFTGETRIPRPSDEVADSRWLPLTSVLDPAGAVSHRVDTSEGALELPAIRLGPWLLWGLTWRILESVLGPAGYPLPRP